MIRADQVPAIETAALTKTFRRQKPLFVRASDSVGAVTTAVDGITLTVPPGTIVGLLGPNGAGKTTFIKLLCTLLLPTAGVARVCGHDVVREAHRVKQLVGLISSEERSFFWRLTGRQNLTFFAALHQLPRAEANRRIDELFDLLDLAEVGDVRFNEYSTGMRQKLGIARGLLNQPRVLFMDEPTKGLDPIAAQALLRLIRQKVVDIAGSTVVVTTHILRDVEQICDRIVIVGKGRIIARGSVDELRIGSRPHDRYRLRVRGLAEERVRALRTVPGVMECLPAAWTDGLVDLRLDLQTQSDALSQVLRQILGTRANVVSCRLEEERLEDVFSNIYHAVEAGNRQVGR